MTHRISQSKSALRKQLREQRNALAANQQATNGSRIANHLQFNSIVHRSQSIAAYVAQDGEADLSLFLHRASAADKQLYLPAITGDRTMVFRLWWPGAVLKPSRLGILELAQTSSTIPAEQLDLVLAPLLGFDALGYRLGMGGGFYDRCFPRYQRRGLKLIGIGHSFQERADLPRQSWDRKLHAVVTEKGVRYF